MSTSSRSRAHLLPIASLVGLSLPLLVGIVALYGEPWAPVLDMALIEQCVRDVGTSRTPLIGLMGRFGLGENPANHPGPLPFYLLAPTYRLLGASAWALQASTVLLHAAAIALALFVASRTRSSAVLAGTVLGLTLLMLGFGPVVLTEPWTPFLVVLWFAVFLVAAWSVAERDLPMLPVVAISGSICAQAHVSYVAVCGGIGAVAMLAVIVAVARAPRGSAERRQGPRWLVVTASALLVCWLPPLIEELRSAPGNISRLTEYFLAPDQPSFGFWAALSLQFSRLDAWRLVVGQWVEPGGFAEQLYRETVAWRSGLTLLVWVGCALWSLRVRNLPLLRLHGLVLLAGVVAVMAMSRIVGVAYGHVALWSSSIGVLLVVAIGATAGVALVRSCPQPSRPKLTRLAQLMAFACVAVATTRLAWAAAFVRPLLQRQTRQLHALAHDTIDAVKRSVGGATGMRGRYIVSWSHVNSLHGASLGVGLANELERAGFDVAFEPHMRPLVDVDRIEYPWWATARIHVAGGAWIAETARAPGAVQLSLVELEKEEERREFDALTVSVVDFLRRAGRADLAELAFYDTPAAIIGYPNPPPLLNLTAARIAELGGACAVFVLPPNVVPVRAR